MPGAPFLVEQAWGAWMAFAGLAIYSARRHLSAVWTTVWEPENGLDDSQEPMRYRWAMIGLVGGLTFLVLFFVKVGANAMPMLLYFVLYFGLFSAVTKMRAEIGPPTHELGSMGTTLMLTKILGSRNLAPQTLTSYALLWFNNRMVRSHQMPVQLEALKMAERAGISYRKLSGAMMGAIAMGVISGFWALLSDAYFSRGATGTGFAGEAFGQLQTWLAVPSGPNYLSMAFIAGGAGFALLLGAARMSIMGWPFHPAGYALGMVFGLDYVWFPLLLAWVLKTVVLRYGGLRVHSSAIPLAVGVIIGEFVIGSTLSSLSVLLGRPMYNFWIF
jgi:hypothetical protein